VASRRAPRDDESGHIERVLAAPAVGALELGDSIDVYVRREDAERFIEEVPGGDDPELAAQLRIEERGLKVVALAGAKGAAAGREARRRCPPAITRRSSVARWRLWR
jgi:hypothetical protein